MRNVLLILFLFCFYSCISQPVTTRASSSITVSDSRFLATLNMFMPRFADTTAANTSIGIDSCGALIFTYDIMGVLVRKCSPKRWEQIGGIINAGEGLQANGTTAGLFGVLATPAQLTVSRSINLRRNGLYMDNSENLTTTGGILWQYAERAYSPFQFSSTDTLAANRAPADSPTADNPISGLFARRVMYYNSGVHRINKSYGHYLGQTYNWLDTMSFDTQGGDYNQGVTIEQRYKPRGVDRQVMRASHGTGNDTRISWAVPTLLVNTYFDNSVTNHIYARGHYSGVNSYAIFGSNSATPDTVQAMVYYTTGSFRGTAGSMILKSYDFSPTAYSVSSVVDSSFGWFDTARVKRSFHAGAYSVGWGDSTVTSYRFKVTGATYHNGLVQNKQGTDIASTAGVMTLNETGNVYEITGTNTVTAINNTNLKNGYTVTLLFTSTAVLTDGTVNSGAAIGMELAGNTNFTGSATDAITLVLGEIGGTQRWFEVSRSVN